jgi:hypothetical protein
MARFRQFCEKLWVMAPATPTLPAFHGQFTGNPKDQHGTAADGGKAQSQRRVPKKRQRKACKGKTRA